MKERTVETNTYSLVYCSRNRIRGTAGEIGAAVESILASSRINNERAGLTGALLFSEGLFAQALEGPLESIERTFERIQRDPRHGDVTVLQMGPAERRDFPEWSMAYKSASGDAAVRFAVPVFGKAFSNPSAGGTEILRLLQDLVVQEDWMMVG